MQRTLFFRLLRQLSTRERSRFHEYVTAPFFNKNVKLIQLWEVVRNYEPDFTAADLNKTRVYPKIYGQKKYNELRLNNLISDLLQHLYNFLAYERWSGDEVWQSAELTQALLHRDNTLHARRIVRRWEQQLHKSNDRSVAYFEQRVRIALAKDRLELTQNRAYSPELQAASSNLDLAYAIHKYQMACDMLSRNRVVNANYQVDLPDWLEQQCATDVTWQQHSVLAIYRSTLRLLQRAKDDKAYQQLIELLDEHDTALPTEERRTVYNYALNHCVRQINLGNTIYYRQIFELYQTLLDREILYQNGYLTQWTYINISAAGIRLGEYAWTESFIETYRHHLPPDEAFNVYTYTRASFYYEKQGPDRALTLLRDVEFTEAFYHAAGTGLQLKAYYDLDLSEPFYALTEAFRQYLRRNRQLSDYQKQSNRNFVKLIQQLQQIRTARITLSSEDWTERLDQFINRLRATEALSHRDWLLTRTQAIR